MRQGLHVCLWGALQAQRAARPVEKVGRVHFHDLRQGQVAAERQGETALFLTGHQPLETGPRKGGLGVTLVQVVRVIDQQNAVGADSFGQLFPPHGQFALQEETMRV